MIIAGDLIPGQRVRWTPQTVEGWAHADASCNEFTSVPWAGYIRELSDPQFEEYFEWSDLTHVGVVVARDFDQIIIRLESPVKFCYVILEHVAYQEEQSGNFEVIA